MMREMIVLQQTRGQKSDGSIIGARFYVRDFCLGHCGWRNRSRGGASIRRPGRQQRHELKTNGEQQNPRSKSKIVNHFIKKVPNNTIAWTKCSNIRSLNPHKTGFSPTSPLTANVKKFNKP